MDVRFHQNHHNFGQTIAIAHIRPKKLRCELGGTYHNRTKVTKRDGTRPRFLAFGRCCAFNINKHIGSPLCSYLQENKENIAHFILGCHTFGNEQNHIIRSHFDSCGIPLYVVPTIWFGACLLSAPAGDRLMPYMPSTVPRGN